jgi:asparagine synthase (glutamine-hydrolysing)
MFLFAITRQAPTRPSALPRSCRRSLGDLVATVAVDDRFFTYESRESGFTIAERFPSLPKPVALSRIDVDEDGRSVVLRRPLLAGMPIYYHLTPAGELYCSSHVGSLKRAGVSVRENSAALPEFLVYNYVTPPRTLYDGIQQVPSGATLRISADNNGCFVQALDRYQPPLPSTEWSDVEAAARQTLALLEMSMGRLQPVEHRIAVLLSGGLDSSILFRIAQQRLATTSSCSTGYPFHTAYENVERDYAVSAASALGAEHAYHEVTVDALQRAFVQSIVSAEEPLVFPQSALFALLFADALGDEQDIVVCGQGADGLFGLPAHHTYAWNEQRTVLQSFASWTPVLALARALLRPTPRNRIRLGRLDHMNRRSRPVSDPHHVVWEFGAVGSEDWVRRSFDAGRVEIVEGRYSSVAAQTDRSIYDLISMLAFFGEIPAMETVWSKLGHRYGRGVFYPFNDETIVAFAFSLPWAVKLSGAKAVLEAVARSLGIPEFIIKRPKSGFGVRPRQIAARGGFLDPFVPLCRGAFDERLLRDMQESRDRRVAQTFWNVVNYAIWKRTVVDGESVNLLLDELDEQAEVQRLAARASR